MPTAKYKIFLITIFFCSIILLFYVKMGISDNINESKRFCQLLDIIIRNYKQVRLFDIKIIYFKPYVINHTI